MRHAFDADTGAGFGAAGGWAPGISLETFARASHELRQPLSGILGHVAALRRSGLGEDEQGQRLLHIQRAAHHMAQVLDAALELSAIVFSSVNGASELVDAAERAQQVADMLRPLADAKGIALVATPGAGSAVCMASRRRLTQVLLNLMGNAVQHCGRGATVTVSVGCTDGRWLTVDVADDGPGIEPHHLARLFQPFYRVPRVPPGLGNPSPSSDGGEKARERRFGSSRAGGEAGEGSGGLGLAIVRALVLQMGGEVDVSSMPGRGTRFGVRIPRVG
jgi:two-component system, OmpR family, phosphate regulon sensor histidine kinase PhoR